MSQLPKQVTCHTTDTPQLAAMQLMLCQKVFVIMHESLNCCAHWCQQDLHGRQAATRHPSTSSGSGQFKTAYGLSTMCSRPYAAKLTAMVEQCNTKLQYGWLEYLGLNKAFAVSVATVCHTLQEWQHVALTQLLPRCVSALYVCYTAAHIVLSSIVEDWADSMLTQHVGCWTQAVLTFTWIQSIHSNSMLCFCSLLRTCPALHQLQNHKGSHGCQAYKEA